MPRPIVAIASWIAGAVIGRMVFALVVVLTVAFVARAAEDHEAHGLEAYWPLMYALLGGLISGAIQYGAVRQTIRDHDRRISEARDLAGKAHDRLYELAREKGHP